MLVQYRAAAPIDALADRQHCLREGSRLFIVEPLAGACRDECRQFDIRQPVVDCVAHEGKEIGLAEPPAEDLRPQRRCRHGRLRMAEYGDCVGARLEDRPGRLGQRRDIQFEMIVDNHVERGYHLAVAATCQNSGQGGKAL